MFVLQGVALESRAAWAWATAALLHNFSEDLSAAASAVVLALLYIVLVVVRDRGGRELVRYTRFTPME